MSFSGATSFFFLHLATNKEAESLSDRSLGFRNITWPLTAFSVQLKSIYWCMIYTWAISVFPFTWRLTKKQKAYQIWARVLWNITWPPSAFSVQLKSIIDPMRLFFVHRHVESALPMHVVCLCMCMCVCHYGLSYNWRFPAEMNSRRSNRHFWWFYLISGKNLFFRQYFRWWDREGGGFIH